MKRMVYLVDPTYDFPAGLSSEHMPLQLGLIAANCFSKLSDKVDVEIFKFIRDFDRAVRSYPPIAVGFSNYVWNLNLGYKLVELIKKELPETLIVFGGPNYPNDFKEQVIWLQEHPLVDIYIHKDGEVPFVGLVKAFLESRDILDIKRAKLPSCHALVGEESFFGELAPRLKTLEEIPSPYQLGLMDKFFEFKLMPSIQGTRGCPHECTFCVEGEKYYNRVAKLSLRRVFEDIDYIFAKVMSPGSQAAKILRILDSNFGMLKRDLEICGYLGDIRRKGGWPVYVSCSASNTRKERVCECSKLLGGAMRLTASVQSLAPAVLEEIKRINAASEAIKLMSDQASDAFHVVSEIILGLPFDSLENQEISMRDLIDEFGISSIIQHQLSLVEGTEVASMKSRGEHGIKGMFRPIQACVGVFSFLDRIFSVVDIEEICVGTETLSFRDYLEARRLYLTVGLFYNDRIFGEIHALFRLLGLSTWEWLKRIHNDILNSPEAIQRLYKEYSQDVQSELWRNPKKLIKNIEVKIDRYMSGSGEIGGNLIYTYRFIALAEHFADLHRTAFRHLREYLADQGIDCERVIKDIEQLSYWQKNDIFDQSFEKVVRLEHDIPKMTQNALWARRQDSCLEDIHYSVQVRISHTSEQKKIIEEQLSFYGDNVAGVATMMSRFPIKRIFRTIEILEKSPS